MNKKIDLKECLESGSKIITGRDYGIAKRKYYGVDKLDIMEGIVEIMVPDDIYGINASFLLGMFGSSIRKFGNQDAFLKKYHFNCQDRIMKNVYDAINRALKTSDVLSK